MPRSSGRSSSGLDVARARTVPAAARDSGAGPRTPCGASRRLGRRVRQVPADDRDVDPAWHVGVAAVGDVEVDAGDELRAGAGAEADVGADPELGRARAVEEEGVVVLVALARRLGDVVLVLRDAVLGRGLAERLAHVAGGEAAGQVVEPAQRAQDEAGAAERATRPRSRRPWART